MFFVFGRLYTEWLQEWYSIKIKSYYVDEACLKGPEKK